MISALFASFKGHIVAKSESEKQPIRAEILI